MLALESRRAQEIRKLIANYGGEPVVVPSVREVPLHSNQQAVNFVRQLEAGQIDVVIFTTGVGTRVLVQAIESVCPRDQFALLLKRTTVVARGPKPTAALRELGVPIGIGVPEPNTWHDLLKVLDEKAAEFPLQGRRVAVQEYGVVNDGLTAALQQRGATVVHVSVYEWALPEDTGPLERAVGSIIDGDIGVMLVASAVQVRHLFQVAQKLDKEDALRSALDRVVLVSVGPLASEEVRGRGLKVDLEVSHPKMGFLVQEAAQKAPLLLSQKQGKV